MSMPKITIYYAAILILIGVIGYLSSGMVSITALIPAFFGVVFVVLGIMAMFGNMRKNAMHVATVLAFIALLFTIGGIFDVASMLSGEPIERPGAAVTKSFMAIFSLIYFALCLWSFISARLLKKEDNAGEKKIEV